MDQDDRQDSLQSPERLRQQIALYRARADELEARLARVEGDRPPGLWVLPVNRLDRRRIAGGVLGTLAVLGALIAAVLWVRTPRLYGASHDGAMGETMSDGAGTSSRSAAAKETTKKAEGMPPAVAAALRRKMVAPEVTLKPVDALAGPKGSAASEESRRRRHRNHHDTSSEGRRKQTVPAEEHYSAPRDHDEDEKGHEAVQPAESPDREGNDSEAPDR